MLIQKSSLTVGEIVAMKLVNGDEIVCRLGEIKESSYVLERPCVVVGGAKGIGLIQAMFSADPTKDIEVGKQHVMMHAEVIKEMQDHYMQVTTGIQVASGGSIVT